MQNIGILWDNRIGFSEHANRLARSLIPSIPAYNFTPTEETLLVPIFSRKETENESRQAGKIPCLAALL